MKAEGGIKPKSFRLVKRELVNLFVLLIKEGHSVLKINKNFDVKNVYKPTSISLFPCLNSCT